jgi:hypothetical protein
LSAASVPAATSAFLPGLSHPFVAVLPQEAGTFLTAAFNRKTGMFILAGFIHHLTQLFRYVEAVKGDFINCTR